MARLDQEEGRNMAAAFNPYRVWLGVASETSPPSHYELLGIAPASTSAETVAEAFRRQMARLNPHLDGEHGAMAKKLAAELANARVVLLTPTTKRAYDAELASRSKSTPGGNAASVQRPQPKSLSSAGSSADALLPPAAGPMPAAAAEPKASLVTPATASVAPVTPPLNQPLPPTAVAGAYPAMAPVPGQVHPQAYGQPYAPAYGGVPQAAPAYSYGQPYPAPVQPFPSQPAYAAQPAPFYPASAPAAATMELPQDPAISSLPSAPSSPLQRTAGRKRSSAGPMLAGLTVAAAVVVGGVVYMVKSDSTPQTVADNSRVQQPTDAQPAAPAPRPGAEGNAVSTPLPSGEPRVVAPSEKPIIAPKVVPAGAADDAAGHRSEKSSSMADAPEAMTDSPKRGGDTAPELKPNGGEKSSPEAMKPEAANSEEKSAASSATKPAAPAAPEEPPEDKAAIEKALNAARKALAARDLDEAEVQLAQATLEATSRESLAKVDRVQNLATRVGEFWNAVRQMLPQLEAGESFEVEGDEVNVVEASAELIVVRVAGKNREYSVAKIPAKLAMTLATRWLDKNSAVTPAVLGAFQAVDPKGDRQQARLYFQQARAGGLDVSPLVEELDAMEKSSDK